MNCSSSRERERFSWPFSPIRAVSLAEIAIESSTDRRLRRVPCFLRAWIDRSTIRGEYTNTQSISSGMSVAALVLNRWLWRFGFRRFGFNDTDRNIVRESDLAVTGLCEIRKDGLEFIAGCLKIELSFGVGGTGF